MGKTSPRTVILDAGALIALEKGDARMRALCREALRTGARFVVPAAVVGQVWRDGARQVAIRSLLDSRITEVPALDRTLAEAAGVLCGRTRTSDIVDASVVLTTRRERGVVITSDPGDLERIDASLMMETI